MKAIGAAIVMLAVLAMTAVPARANSADDGKELFRQKCAICHGPNGAGDGPMAKASKLTIPDLGSKDVQAMSDADIKKVITTGKGNMKPVKDLSGKDLSNLLAFIRSLAKK